MKNRCNVVQSVPQNNNVDPNDQVYFNENISLKPDTNDQNENEELCPSDYSGLTSYPYNCKKFVNCWKGILLKDT